MTVPHARRTPSRFSVSTWSVKRVLGNPALYGVEQGFQIPLETHGKGTHTLLELPEQLVVHGIRTVEICHFHLPSLDSGYLAELRAELQRREVELFSVLIDSGDIANAATADRDLDWLTRWLDIAAELGARCARVAAGMVASDSETLARSAQNLLTLAGRAERSGLRLMTENWKELLSTPEAVHALFERLNGHVGLCLDFGNWHGETKYADLRSIAPYAESCHAKAYFSETGIDHDDYLACLELLQEAGFSGPYTLIYDDADPDEWGGLLQEMHLIQPYLQG
ncbi:sugar phosphate isomerase/epimerase [Thermosporothrix hazakensis]|jgi:sugar phosphate isomerase/epimerase|uniref:Sugar phosphate isomerase/epimerase n=2 Tax=Thermosporothrix TaxID=768650 RepID=A0A326UBE1_THEHA|nr:sugar phosphate isomerase/epimerase family protein [Thermosporothrix hazakensis]PZW34400.1 sugar phosphate isomerase/epimerase [Thermosporothrix hazakensis]BBH85523.1 sugar phosphate isomerase [Thermosporothrix sp. COM3]GCE46050.1 sugar phosphate isomerase [Thermosporothrix hazakensis]